MKPCAVEAQLNQSATRLPVAIDVIARPIQLAGHPQRCAPTVSGQLLVSVGDLNSGKGRDESVENGAIERSRLGPKIIAAQRG
jgi:hypothetical protein